MHVILHINTQNHQLLAKAGADRMASSVPLTWAVLTMFSLSFICQANALGMLVCRDRCHDRSKRAALQAGAAAQNRRKISKNIFEKAARVSLGEPVTGVSYVQIKNIHGRPTSCQNRTICRTTEMKILPTEFDGQSIGRVYDEDTET